MRGGRNVMRSQLRRLLNQAELDNVLLHVRPLAVDAGPAYVGQFQLLDIGAPILSATLTDHPTGQWIIEDSEQVDQYRTIFAKVRSSCLPEAASLEMIHSIMSEL